MADLITKEVNTSKASDDVEAVAARIFEQARVCDDASYVMVPRFLIGKLREAIKAHGIETGATQGHHGHVAGCMCSRCRSARLVEYANAQKALEQPQCSGLCQGHSSEASLSGWLPDANCPVHGLKATLSEGEPR